MQIRTALATITQILFNMHLPMIFLAILTGSVSAQRRVTKSATGASPLIIKQDSQVNPDGSYSYSFETENGISVDESGYLKNVGSQDEAQTVQGSYSYTAPDGTPITVTYTADENGFKAQGAHLPVAPELPPLIAKALAYNAAKAIQGGGNLDLDFNYRFIPRRPNIPGQGGSPDEFPPLDRPSYNYPAAGDAGIVPTKEPPKMGFHSGCELQ